MTPAPRVPNPMPLSPQLRPVWPWRRLQAGGGVGAALQHPPRLRPAGRAPLSPATRRDPPTGPRGDCGMSGSGDKWDFCLPPARLCLPLWPPVKPRQVSRPHNVARVWGLGFGEGEAFPCLVCFGKPPGVRQGLGSPHRAWGRGSPGVVAAPQVSVGPGEPRALCSLQGQREAPAPALQTAPMSHRTGQHDPTVSPPCPHGVPVVSLKCPCNVPTVSPQQLGTNAKAPRCPLAERSPGRVSLLPAHC